MNQRIEAVSSCAPVSSDFLEYLNLNSIEEMCMIAALKNFGYQSRMIIQIVDKYKIILTEAKERDTPEWFAEYKRLMHV